MFKKKMLACALALFCAFGMTSCNLNSVDGDGNSPQTSTNSQTEPGTKQEETILNVISGDNSEYKIIYSATADGWAYESAEYISNKIAVATGVTLRIGSDAAIEPSEHEIIIGDTNRGEALGFDVQSYDWEQNPIHVGVYGKKILITAESSIGIYDKLSFVMDEWLKEADTKKLDMSEKMCQKITRAIETADDNVIKLLLQNLCVWGDAPNTPQERLERVFKEFTYYDADIIGVSEQDDDWLPELPDLLLPEGYTRLGGKNLFGTEGDWNNIYYKTEKFDVIDWNIEWYGGTPGTMLTGAKNKQVFTWAIFEIKATGVQFMVLNTHLHAYADYGPIRTQQIEIFSEFLKPYMSQYPVYIMGDMNIEETHSQYATMLETYYDSRDIAKENLSGNDYTYNAFGNQKEADGDYIFTGKGDGQEVLWYKIINEKRFGDYSIDANEWVSDHYGVCIQTRVY